MLISSAVAGINDENHGWNAVVLNQTENCWVKNVTAKNFGYACVTLNDANQTTVEDCAMIDPVSITTGGRKYSFNISKGTFNLFQRCYTRGGRHDYVTGARVAGPNVFLDCFAENTFSDIGPHHRYATGILFDNIEGGMIRVQNRGTSGTGHGWAGAQTMFWNLKANGVLKVESPKGAMNWGIGCSGNTKEGAGYWESWGQNVEPRSLYLQQLKDRLGDTAVNNIVIPEQLEGNIYDKLKSWAGISDINTAAFSNHAEQELKFYPNPCKEMLYIITNSKHDDIMSVYSIQGKKQKVAIKKQGNTIQFNTSNLKSGIYLFKISSSNGTSKSGRFIR
ncbi:MAG: T9SS type A sorting domain-containing protein, partial [Bacteroidales bacterium]|nr:T9SS type A sorting domain-containing protein [Bacteroidales bacterium]